MIRADVIVARCRRGHGGYGIRVEERDGGDWYATWAFTTDEERAARDGYGMDTRIGGILRIDDAFPGCPYCAAPSFSVCRCLNGSLAHHTTSAAGSPAGGRTVWVTIEAVTVVVAPCPPAGADAARRTSVDAQRT